MNIDLSATPTKKRFFAPVQIDYDNKQYIPAFDGWRGVGVILVMLAHCYPNMITRPFWVAMDLFFVMSGFLITGILLDSKQNQHYYKNYIVRRVLRVFPLYYFVLVLSFLVIPYTIPGIMGVNYDFYTKNQAWFWLYGQNWLFSIKGLPEINHSMVHFWSLAVEEQFYIFWPLLIKFFKPKQIVRICVGIILFSVYFRVSLGFKLGLVQPYPYMNTFSRMDSLAIGSIIAIVIRYNKAWLEKYLNVIAVASFICLLLGFAYFRTGTFLRLYPIFTFVDIFAGCILLYSLSPNKSALIRVGDHSLFRFLGKYSYGIYIYHYIIFNSLDQHFHPYILKHINSEAIAVTLTGVLTIGISIVIAIASFRYLEMPFLKLKKYFAYK